MQGIITFLKRRWEKTTSEEKGESFRKKQFQTSAVFKSQAMSGSPLTKAEPALVGVHSKGSDEA